MTFPETLEDGEALAEDAIIATGWSAGFGYGGMATVFRLGGLFYAAPGVSDYARKSLTVKEAKYLVANGKAVRADPPHL